ncbi:MAG: DUF6232 family protein [Planctomycetota bacterium]
MRETNILTQNNVQVTTRRLVIGARTYQLSNIASFTTVEIQPAPSVFGFFAFLGGLGALGYAIYVGVDRGTAEAADFVVVQGGWRWIAGGVASLLAAWLRFRSLKIKYAVQLATSSGAFNAIVSTDRVWVDRIASALSEAMEFRG